MAAAAAQVEAQALSWAEQIEHVRRVALCGWLVPAVVPFGVPVIGEWHRELPPVLKLRRGQLLKPDRAHGMVLRRAGFATVGTEVSYANARNGEIEETVPRLG